MRKLMTGAGLLGVMGLVLGGLAVCALSGCNGGAEEVKPGNNPNPGAVPHGASVDEYRAGMQRAKQGAYGPGGGPAGGPGGAGAPGAPGR